MAIYLGIDAGTQGIKAELIETTNASPAGTFAVNFGTELPQYASLNGYIPNPDPLIKQADPLMWLDALELLFFKMRDAGVRMEKIAGISGSAQQHGSVYLNEKFNGILANLEKGQALSEQLRPALSRLLSPIWMDRSTSAECRELNDKFGSRIQSDTGSPACERFTGPQIRRFAKSEPENYEKTAVIHLVSSFLCSVLIGKSSPIDYGDGAGMNLLNLTTLKWDDGITDFTATGLLKKLPDCVSSNTIAGNLPEYFAKYGFTPGIPVTAWSGDNPNSLIGVGAGSPGTAVISLGTSDTFFAAMKDFKTDPDGYGHVFGNPAGGFMSLICFSNGSLAREKVRNESGLDWLFFEETVCRETVPGNNGKLMLPYFEPESTPLVLAPEVKYNFTEASDVERLRIVMESQALSMRLHSAWLNEDFKRIRVTGGASKSKAFCRILADVFQAEIETIAISDSAGLGAAMRAANSIGKISFDKLCHTFCVLYEIIKPDQKNARIYENMLCRYAEFEKHTINRL